MVAREHDAPAAARDDRRAVLLRRLAPSWPLIAGLLFFLRLLVARHALLNDPDTYLHIAAGHWMLMHGALPVHDPFSHSMPGALWPCGEWLAEIALAACYALSGWGGVMVLTAACAAAALALLARFLLRPLPPLPALIAVAAAAALLEPHMLARPHVLALPLLVLWSGQLLAARDAGRGPPFLLLPVIALWANLHASFLFGLALAAFAAVEAAVQSEPGTRAATGRRWAAFVGAAVLAALLTPSGIDGIIAPIRLMRMPALQNSFVEWLSPDFRKFAVLELWILGALFIGFSSGARPPWTRVLLLLGLVHMVLQHARYADVLAIVGPLGLAAPLGRTLAGLMPPSRLSRRVAALSRPARPAGVVLALAVALGLALPVVLRPVARGDDAVTPGAALAAARRLGLSGPVLNSEGFGGYLIFRGVPTFIDGRAEMYGNDFIAQAYRAENGDRAVLARLLAHYRIAWALLKRHSAEAAALDGLPGWRRVYVDRYAAVYTRTAGPPR